MNFPESMLVFFEFMVKKKTHLTTVKNFHKVKLSKKVKNILEKTQKHKYPDVSFQDAKLDFKDTKTGDIHCNESPPTADSFLCCRFFSRLVLVNGLVLDNETKKETFLKRHSWDLDDKLKNKWITVGQKKLG